MFCTQCRTELPEESQYCSKCGATQSASHASVKPRSVSVRRGFLAVVVVGLVIILLFAVARITAPNQTNDAALLKHMASVGAQPRQAVIANTAITVKQLSYSYYKFDVPFNSTNVWIDGHFQASGGAGNDIEVYLLDQDGFVNWQNNHAVTTYFNSGRLTEGKISATLPSQGATYYLIFNNRFSLLSPKAIQLSAMLHYTN